ncbi:uncharacterized protein RAG0_12903 [Rhynchosporium agropyri]|uniref:Uncharacterized protein n=1 Tax=Rhynchosporium agropyri TaxID=914238 RepID=A0A1E1LAS5_9HELO|nr:uncharacterized protein RAG0_12903 [Rhynchosporium agropyri]
MSWECSERVARLLVALMDRLQYSDGYPSGTLSKVFRPKIYRSFIPPISSFKANGRVPQDRSKRLSGSKLCSVMAVMRWLWVVIKQACNRLPLRQAIKSSCCKDTWHHSNWATLTYGVFQAKEEPMRCVSNIVLSVYGSKL